MLNVFVVFFFFVWTSTADHKIDPCGQLHSMATLFVIVATATAGVVIEVRQQLNWKITNI